MFGSELVSNADHDAALIHAGQGIRSPRKRATVHRDGRIALVEYPTGQNRSTEQKILLIHPLASE